MLRPGDAIVLCVLCLLCIGVLMVNSAGLSVGGEGPGVTFLSIVFSRSSVYMALAVAAMLAVSRMPLWWLAGRERGAVGLWIAAAALIGLCLLVYVPGVGREINGARRWIGLPFIGAGDLGFQPSEVAKWALILALALYAASQGAKLAQFRTGLTPALLAIGLVAGVIVLEDLGTATLIIATSTLMLLAAGARFAHFAMLAPIGLIVLVAAVITKPYRVRRLTTFLDPFEDPAGAGYHMIQSMVAVANGEIFGRGLGFGLQKFGYLPADRTDFLFAVLCEELGLAGAAVVIALYLGLLWAGWKILLRERLVFLRLVALGVIATVGLQALLNLAVVTGLGPTKGIALPLLSSGGTGWILTAASLGLLVAMDRRHQREELMEEAGVIQRSPAGGSGVTAGSPSRAPAAARSLPMPLVVTRTGSCDTMLQSRSPRARTARR
ncbi:MAG: cell division protein FtsW [Phycisphaeraceae bacterium]|nr:MAG: cell division protein FtsW [Phycisphaeraceae bacterium]